MGELQRLAVIQLVGRDEMKDDQEALLDLSANISKEDVQLYYQIAVQGRSDLTICRDPRSSVEMTLLRMLAFRPAAAKAATDSSAGQRPTEPKPAPKPRVNPAAKLTPKAKSEPAAVPENSAAGNPETAAARIVSVQPISGDWATLLNSANVSGAARQLAEHCTIKEQTGSRLALTLAEESAHLNTVQVKGRLEAVLGEHLGYGLRLDIGTGSPSVATPAQLREAGEDQRMRSAREAIEQDPNVQAVQAAFDAVLETDSIQPAEK
jgi:DNA polymerase-3 subunit gamma/tau